MCAAAANAASTAASIAPLETEAEIAGRLVPDRGAPGGQRRRGLDDRRQRPVLDRDPLGGVARRSALSATTSATGSPTWRTRPRASAWRAGTIIGSMVLTWATQGSGPTPSARRSAS